MTPHELGKRGERRAAWFYRLRGYSIIARNARHHAGEVDLVVRKKNVLAIVEVKARQSRMEGHEAVNRAKRERLVRLGDHYAAQYPEAMLRYDILSLHWDGRKFEVSHYEDAFRPTADAKRPWLWRA